MAYKTITVRQDGAVDWLTLNRPDRLNTLTGTMVEELCDYFDGLKQDYGVRIVVMRGAGRAFCAGLDIREHQSGEPMDLGGGSPQGGGMTDKIISMAIHGGAGALYVRLRRAR